MCASLTDHRSAGQQRRDYSLPERGLSRDVALVCSSGRSGTTPAYAYDPCTGQALDQEWEGHRRGHHGWQAQFARPGDEQAAHPNGEGGRLSTDQTAAVENAARALLPPQTRSACFLPRVEREGYPQAKGL